MKVGKRRFLDIAYVYIIYFKNISNHFPARKSIVHK